MSRAKQGFRRGLPLARAVAGIVLLAFITLLFKAKAEEKTRHFRARQVFQYGQPILFEADFAADGFDRLNLSIDGRYRLPAPEPDRLAITAAPGEKEKAAAVAFTVPRAANSYRSEISLPSEKGFQERWYRIRLLVPDDWQVDHGKGADIVVQWHAVPGNWRATYPNLAIAVEGEHWWIKQSFGNAQQGPSRPKLKLDAPIVPGQWTTWVIHARWSPKEDGRLRVWQNEVQVADLKGPNVYGSIGLEYTPYLKTGIYHPEWNLSDERKTKAFSAEENPVTRKRIYVSELLVGDASADFTPQASPKP